MGLWIHNCTVPPLTGTSRQTGAFSRMVKEINKVRAMKGILKCYFERDVATQTKEYKILWPFLTVGSSMMVVVVMMMINVHIQSNKHTPKSNYLCHRQHHSRNFYVSHGTWLRGCIHIFRKTESTSSMFSECSFVHIFSMVWYTEFSVWINKLFCWMLIQCKINYISPLVQQ
jgi:hypothetical protein